MDRSVLNCTTVTVGRPLKYDSDEVIKSAMGLFWRNGYEATSLHDLVGAMGLSRSSFYQAFGGKRQLFLRCLERYQAETAADLSARLAAASTGIDFIEETLLWAIEEVIEGADPRGCLIMNTATEFAQRDPDVARLVASGLGQYREIFRLAVRRAQSEGAIATDRDPEAIAGYLVTSMSGLRTMVKAGTHVGSLRSMVDVAVGAL